jgi:hypothetical protein
MQGQYQNQQQAPKMRGQYQQHHAPQQTQGRYQQKTPQLQGNYQNYASYMEDEEDQYDEELTLQMQVPYQQQQAPQQMRGKYQQPALHMQGGQYQQQQQQASLQKLHVQHMSVPHGGYHYGEDDTRGGSYPPNQQPLTSRKGGGRMVDHAEQYYG